MDEVPDLVRELLGIGIVHAVCEPAFSIFPVFGEQFTKRVLTPFDENAFEFLVFQGSHIDQVMRLLASGSEVQGADGRFVRFIENDPRRRQEYLALGYPIASGVIEGACRHFVKDRMERSGMRWTIESAQAMLDVRSTYLNGDWDTFMKYRIEQGTQRLYPHRELVEPIETPGGIELSIAA